MAARLVDGELEDDLTSGLFPVEARVLIDVVGSTRIVSGYEVSDPNGYRRGAVEVLSGDDAPPCSLSLLQSGERLGLGRPAEQNRSTHTDGSTHDRLPLLSRLRLTVSLSSPEQGTCFNRCLPIQRGGPVRAAMQQEEPGPDVTSRDAPLFST